MSSGAPSDPLTRPAFGGACSGSSRAESSPSTGSGLDPKGVEGSRDDAAEPGHARELHATRYARIRHRVLLTDLVGQIAFLLVFQLTGASASLARWTGTLTPVAPWQLAVYLTVFGLCSYIVFLPLHLYSSFSLEHRFGLSRLSVNAWLIREAKQVSLGAGFGLVVMEAFYALLRSVPRAWPLWATIGWVLLSVVIARVFPTWLVPLFYKTTTIQDASLVQRLLTLCERAKLSALGVFRVDLGVETRKANAALAGLGGTRRVLLSDTLLENFTPEEIETVLAHELGHQRHHHIRQFLVLSAIGSLLAFSIIDRTSNVWIARFGLSGLSDVAGFPMLMLSLSLLGLIGLPLQNGLSRYFERQADRFAVTLTRLPTAFAAALRKLGELNLADPNPPRWIEWLFYDHPAIHKRIAAAEAASLAGASHARIS